MLYTTLKKYGEFKKGETFDSADVELSQEDIDEAIENGFIKESDGDTQNSKGLKRTVVCVKHNGGVREFSKEIHGDDFADLAKEFATTNNGEIIE